MTVKMPVYLVYLKDRTFVFERLAFRNPLFVREVFQCATKGVIVGLDATTKGSSPLVGESKVSCPENNYFAFIRVLHTNN
jgi:hypothetical protein